MSGPGISDMYDQALLAVLQHCGDIRSFLHVYFGFLYRKTDFYRLLLPECQSLGFPPGEAQKMVLQAFKTFERLALQDREKRVEEETLKKKMEEEAMTSAPPAVKEEVVECCVEGGAAEAGSRLQEMGNVDGGAQEAARPAASASSPPEQPEGATASSTLESAPTLKTQEDFQANPDSYNGAVRENYTWSQDYTDLEIKLHVPKMIVKGRQVSVDIQSGSVRVALFEGGGQRVLMEGKLTHRINTENSLWSLEPGKCIVLNLNKSGEYWWNAVLEGEETIDIDKINKERSMATVDEDEHAVLDRLTFDYHQKLQGKPQSHEMKVHEMLKKGWDAEGSPFKGQKFDPSMFNISPGAVQF
ncbi:nudC domain-containing protein 3 [Latimeria chalumnae]|uniref:NudC domain-containing protein 3 n=1 Tax=Latimeria chalumnae TaxID=7897 RepID=H3B322_LATCH|nr:PREDICTED: nudC domain-containing protein 3 [Latimeria chalumnae]|eukprot:XP_005988256.1 PREDICTED: nudC domain-containing protein 3 [Latimeria chalumnae]